MNYELTVLLPEKVTAAKKKSEIEKLEKLIKVFGGKVIKNEDWGEKQFTYPIKKNISGSYLYFEIELPEEGAKNLPSKLNLDEGVLRHLLIRKEVKNKKATKGK